MLCTIGHWVPFPQCGLVAAEEQVRPGSFSHSLGCLKGRSLIRKELLSSCKSYVVNGSCSVVVSVVTPQSPGLLLPVVSEQLKFVKSIDSDDFFGTASSPFCHLHAYAALTSIQCTI